MTSLSHQLLKKVLSVYLLVTVLIFSGQVALEYRAMRQNVMAELEMLHDTFDRSVSLALWNFDKNQLRTTLEGMLNMPSVSRVTALMPDGQMILDAAHTTSTPQAGLWSLGDYSSRRRLVYQDVGRQEEMGWLEIQSNGELIARRLMDGVMLNALAALLKTAVLVFLVKLFFDRILSRPLLHMAQVAAAIDPQTPPSQPLVAHVPARDELDVIASAINNLSAQVRRTVTELDALNHGLEDEVVQRTAQLQSARDSLVQTEKSLGGLVAGIAHEINTPVGLGLTGTSHFKYMVEKLEAQYRAGELAEPEFERFMADSKELARSIFLSLEKAAALVRSFKQVAVDQTSDTLRSFNFKDYLGDVLLTHSPQIKAARVSVNVSAPSDWVVTSYPGAWAQILSNLINNAIVHAFGPDQLNPQVSPRLDLSVTISTDVTPQRFSLRFSDNGQGMSADTARQVYAPFFTTNRQGGGSGLGMHIVYNLVTQKLLGQIAVESQPGLGTTFTVSAPLTL